MPDNSAPDNAAGPREQFLDLLLSKVAVDPYPSSTMMDYLEELLEPDEVPAYASVLMDKIYNDNFPSVSLMKRLVGLLG